jgi:hypothetical protein
MRLLLGTSKDPWFSSTGLRAETTISLEGCTLLMDNNQSNPNNDGGFLIMSTVNEDAEENENKEKIEDGGSGGSGGSGIEDGKIKRKKSYPLLRINIPNRKKETESWFLAVGTVIADCERRKKTIASSIGNGTPTTTTSTTTTPLTTKTTTATTTTAASSTTVHASQPEQLSEPNEDPETLEDLLARANAILVKYRDCNDQDKVSISPILSMLASAKRKYENHILTKQEFSQMIGTQQNANLSYFY